jgi:indolepyruvate ferredoxin oxidoreductase beta subunit
VKYDVILAGVGGQGVLSVAAIIALGAMKDGLSVRQSEVHGMAQRGGAVQAHLRLSDRVIVSDLIGKASADMILSMEPIESLRYLDYLKAGGVLVTSADPVQNIPNYPEIEGIYARIRALPSARLIRSAELAREAGSARASNLVMVGAASLFLPVREESLLAAVEELFSRKGKKVVEANIKAFGLGRGSPAAASR